MNDKIKRLMNFRMDRYQELETKLGEMAARGLVLEGCGTWLWTFRKAEPRRRTYTVTYFAEGSLFNPEMTDNQQTYVEYAKAAGWEFVTQLNQMQIFCTEDENAVPFETDEADKLQNIKRCMRKSYIPSIVAMILVFLFNLGVNYSSFANDRIDFLSDTVRLLSISMMLVVVLYFTYLLADYFLWCRQSEKSIAAGGECVARVGGINRIIDAVVICYSFGVLGLFILNLAADGNWVMLLFAVTQMPILIIVFRSSISYLKKKKTAAMENRILSGIVLIVTSFCYMAFVLWAVMDLDIGASGGSDYRTVSWQLTASESHDYKLYSDEIPLTCEALYGQIDYDYYSYEEQVDSSIFLTRSSYMQNSLPAKDAPPSLLYEIIETKLGWVYDMAREQLLEMPPWRDYMSWQTIDNGLFGTVEAYQRDFDDDPSGGYVLLYGDRIITLNMDEEATPAQIRVIREALQL